MAEQPKLTPEQMDKIREQTLKAWHIQLQALTFFINRIMMEMAHSGKPLSKDDNLPVACERIKLELQELQTMISGPQIIKPPSIMQ